MITMASKLHRPPEILEIMFDIKYKKFEKTEIPNQSIFTSYDLDYLCSRINKPECLLAFLGVNLVSTSF